MTRPWRMRCVNFALKEASIEYADGGNMSIVGDPVSTATADALEAIFDRAAGLRALVVGDVMLDEYRSGSVERTSPEAPVPVVRVQTRSVALGGAGNVARNVLSMGATCDLVGLVGRDEESERLIAEMASVGLDSSGLVASEARPTTHKLRVGAQAKQLIRLDRESHASPSEPELDALKALIEERVASCDIVILEDYDKGLFADGLGRFVIERAQVLDKRVIADPKTDLRRFRGADLVKPNLAEATSFVGIDGLERSNRIALLEKLREELGGGEVVVTRGELGMSALDAAGTFRDVPTQPLEVFDVQGAGDTSVAALALCRAAGASLVEACIVANAASAVAVEKVGTARVDRAEVIARIPEILTAQTSA